MNTRALRALPLTLTLDMEFDSITDRESFVEDVVEDVSAAANIDSRFVKVIGMRAGSVIVDMQIASEAGDLDQIGQHLVEQVKPTDSALRRGKVTSKTIKLARTLSLAGSMASLLPHEECVVAEAKSRAVSVEGRLGKTVKEEGKAVKDKDQEERDRKAFVDVEDTAAKKMEEDKFEFQSSSSVEKPLSTFEAARLALFGVGGTTVGSRRVGGGRGGGGGVSGLPEVNKKKAALEAASKTGISAAARPSDTAKTAHTARELLSRNHSRDAPLLQESRHSLPLQGAVPHLRSSRDPDGMPASAVEARKKRSVGTPQISAQSDRFMARAQLQMQQVDTQDGNKTSLSSRSPQQALSPRAEPQSLEQEQKPFVLCAHRDRERRNQWGSSASGSVTKAVDGGEEKSVRKGYASTSPYLVNAKNLVDSSNDTSDDDNEVRHALQHNTQLQSEHEAVMAEAAVLKCDYQVIHTHTHTHVSGISVHWCEGRVD